MKYRTLLYALIGLLALAGLLLWLYFTVQSQESPAVLAATVDRDCAPWDGSAFTVSIPYDFGSVIQVSIWRSPDIGLPITYSFPDRTGSIGNAVFQPKFGSPEQLTGKVSFQGVEQGDPVEGEFSLATAKGRQLKGKFKAEWGHQMVACG